jgi:class 3 adenylate cyclase
MANEEFYRLDLQMKVLSIDDNTKTFQFVLVPREDRYEWVTRDGERYLFDQLDSSMIPESVFKDMMRQVEGKPIFHQPARLGDVHAYAGERLSKIEQYLQDASPVPLVDDGREEFLKSIEGQEIPFAIVSIDIVGSTSLLKTIGNDKYRLLFGALLYEAGEILPSFNGRVLKHTGDGLIAYFTPPSFVSQNDLGVKFARSLQVVLAEALNPAASQAGFPAIQIRTGMDSGDAIVATLGSPNAMRDVDLVGAAVSLACKIQAIGNPGDILLGERAVRSLHTTIRKSCEPVSLPSSWQYRNNYGGPYQVYRLADDADLASSDMVLTS